jgi:hypothetical protein
MFTANITKRFVKLCQNFYAGLIHLLAKLSSARLLSQRKGSKLNCYCTDISYKPFLSNNDFVSSSCKTGLSKLGGQCVLVHETHVPSSTTLQLASDYHFQFMNVNGQACYSHHAFILFSMERTLVCNAFFISDGPQLCLMDVTTETRGEDEH